MAVNYGALSADGQSSEFTVQGNSGVWTHLSGTFSSGNIDVQMKGLDGTWRDIAGSNVTSAADKLFDLPHGTKIRYDLAGSGSPTIYYQFGSVTLRM